MHDQDQPKQTVAWTVVGVILLGCVTAGIGIILASFLVSGIGAAVIVIGGLLAIILPKAGAAAPISYTENVPDTTVGPRATDDGEPRPPIDTEPDKTRSRAESQSR